MTDSTPGWQPDPTGRHDHRYWDGSRWTDDVADAGVAAKDPYDGPAGAASEGAAIEGEAPSEADAVTPAPHEPSPSEPDAPGSEPTVVGAAPWSEPTTIAPTPADTTTAWPAAGASAPPPSYSAPPPPTAPLAPAAAASASSGSKKGFLIGLGVLLVVALGVGAFLLLGGDDDGGDRDRIRAELASAIQSSRDVTDDQADCLADHVIDEIGEDRLEGVDFSAEGPPEDLRDDYLAAVESNDCGVDPDGGTRQEVYDAMMTEILAEGDLTESEADCMVEHLIDEIGLDRLEGVDFSADEPPADLADDFEDAFGSGIVACDIDVSGTGGASGDDGGTDDAFGDDGDLGTDFGTDDAFGAEFEEMLADIYADSFGISQDKAECLAGKIADAMDSGELGEEEMMSDIFEYFEECDISMSEISGGGG